MIWWENVSLRYTISCQLINSSLNRGTLSSFFLVPIFLLVTAVSGISVFSLTLGSFCKQHGYDCKCPLEKEWYSTKAALISNIQAISSVTDYLLSFCFYSIYKLARIKLLVWIREQGAASTPLHFLLKFVSLLFLPLVASITL